MPMRSKDKKDVKVEAEIKEEVIVPSPISDDKVSANIPQEPENDNKINSIAVENTEGDADFIELDLGIANDPTYNEGKIEFIELEIDFDAIEDDDDDLFEDDDLFDEDDEPTIDEDDFEEDTEEELSEEDNEADTSLIEKSDTEESEEISESDTEEDTRSPIEEVEPDTKSDGEEIVSEDIKSDGEEKAEEGVLTEDEIAEDDASSLDVREEEPTADEDTEKPKITAPIKENHTGKTPHKKAQKGEQTRKVDGIFDFIELFVFTLVVVLFVTSFIARHSIVDGDSMLGTLHHGETLIISDLFYEPRVGDIVVVDDHSTILKKPIIKRVIAVGGDTVRVTKVGIVVNGELLDEPYVYTDGLPYTYNVYPSDAYLDNPTLCVEAGVYYEFVVPEGEIFVLGDHRNDSTDSRAIGTVDVDAVLGRVLFRLLPFEVFGKVN